MAIVVTAGSASAVAYDTAANADAYFTARGIATWTGTDAVKESALIRGADYLERKYAGKWKGVKAAQTQALAFPRNNLVDLDGYSIDYLTIPEEIKRANFEAALLVLTGVDIEPVLDRGGATTTEKVKAGPVEVETVFAGGSAARKAITTIDGLLTAFVETGGSMQGLLRA